MTEDQLRKKCSRCGKDKPVSEFAKCGCNKDGLQRHCRQCRSEEHKIWYKGPSHEKAKKYMREYMRNYTKSEKYKEYNRNRQRELRKRKSGK